MKRQRRFDVRMGVAVRLAMWTKSQAFIQWADEGMAGGSGMNEAAAERKFDKELAAYDPAAMVKSLEAIPHAPATKSVEIG